MTLVLALFAIILLFFILEDLYLKRKLRKIPVRILVNGTRGKTTTVRLIVAALEAAGIKALGKTTGSEAAVILPGSKVEKIRRRKGARLEENIAFARRAVEEGAQAIVVECMALRDETQRMMRDKFVRPTAVVITNTLSDHAAEMGPEKGDVVHALSCCVPRGAKLYVTGHEYDGLEADIHHVEVVHNECESPLATHDEDVCLALAVLEDLGVDRGQALHAFSSAIPDVGLQGDIDLRGNRFIPSFSVNDKESMTRAIEEAGGKLTVVFNNRADREYRIAYIEEALLAHPQAVEKVIAVGDYKAKTARHIAKRTHLPCQGLTPVEALEEVCRGEGRTILCLGNIKGAGEELISLAKEV